MKTLHVITTLDTGGAEKLMVDLLPRLRDMGNGVELAVFNTGETPFYKDLRNAGIKIHAFSGPGSVYNPLHIIRLFKLMRNFDVVHTHNTSPQIFAAICSLFCSSVLFTTEHNTNNRRRNWPGYKWIDKWMYSRYDSIICISDQAEKNLKDYLGEKQNGNICTIYNGVDVSRFVEASQCEEIVDEFRGLHTAIMVAGFREQKDHKTLIRAYKHLPEDYHLLLVGDGETRQEIEGFIQDLQLENRIHLLGLRRDVPNLLKSVDVVVMSSHYEGLSLSNIEGMASGAPFVASDVDGIREITEGFGILFPHEDDKTLSEIILKLTTDSEYREETVKKCEMRALQYDIKTMAERYNKVYNS